ncbi:restriction endonuclease subunit S [Riemerella anatipestifer]|uniref:restriction endonuclease subunit S n=1 Tax=Riemerella anatipestifer TaxID=34085 RepID=UPI0030C4E771
MERVKISKAVTIINDSVSEYKGKRPYLSTGNLDVSEIVDLEYFSFKEKPSRANLNVQAGDILLARMKGTIKVKAVSEDEENIIVSTGFLVLRSKENVDKQFLFHLFNSSIFQNEKNELCTGATQKSINNNNFLKIEIPLPPLEEQQAIAEKLDQAQKIIDLNEAEVARYDKLAQALFIDMFGDPVQNPKGWEMKKLGEITNKIGSGATPRGGKESYKEEGIALIRSMNVYDNRFFYKDLAFIDSAQADKLKNVCVEENDILFNITGASICRSTIVPKDVLPARVNQHVSIIRMKKSVATPLFVNHLLISASVKRSLLNIGSGGGAIMQAITKQGLEDFEIILPPITLQNEFAKRIEQIEILKNQAQQELEQSKNLFQSLLQESFKG